LFLRQDPKATQLLEPTKANSGQLRSSDSDSAFTSQMLPNELAGSVAVAADKLGHCLHHGRHLAESLALASRVGDVPAGLEPVHHRRQSEAVRAGQVSFTLLSCLPCSVFVPQTSAIPGTITTHHGTLKTRPEQAKRAFPQVARLRGSSLTTQGSAVRTRHRPRRKPW
jgi:hypothetical protein